MRARTVTLTLATTLALAAAPRPADAFCGFYVSGADAKLFNNATLVVLMRDGTRTVLSMQNNYEGPPESFAMVVPVPVVLQEENVKTLPREIFSRVDQMAAPRLVEYWEQDPCAQRDTMQEGRMGPKRLDAPAAAADKASAGYQVKIEAEFTVGEYDIVILSAKDSSGLDRWLRDSNYKIPDGAEPVLRPYVEQGMKFFVAKVDASKVKFEKRDGRDMAMLSPLRFHYDSDTFSLPVRLGLLNSNGTQDLLVHILAPGKRYEVANYPNVTIPTNLDLAEGAKAEFGSFYAALFDRTLEKNPKAVVTEYAWDAQSCDPCPTPALSQGEIMTLGGDVPPESSDGGPRVPRVTIAPVEGEPNAQRYLASAQASLQACYQRALESEAGFASKVSFAIETDAKGDVTGVTIQSGKLPAAMETCAKGAFSTLRLQGVPKRKLTVSVDFAQIAQRAFKPYTLTRLHARYGKDTLGEDLVFKEASPIVGGREIRNQDKLESGSSPSSFNNFQGRYAIRHEWTGPINCNNPKRGIWGGPPPGAQAGGIKAAIDLAFAPRGKTNLAGLVRQDIPELDLKTTRTPSPPKGQSRPDDKEEASAPKAPADSGCACESSRESGPRPTGWLAGVALMLGCALRRTGRR